MGSSSLTRDQTQAPCVGSVESEPLDHQGSPSFLKHFEKKILYSTFIYSFPSAFHFFMLIQVPTLFIIFLPEECSFNISHKTSLVVMKSFSFYLSGNLFMSSSFLKEQFTQVEYSWLSGFLNIPSHSSGLQFS